jgi:hypothetical protein
MKKSKLYLTFSFKIPEKWQLKKKCHFRGSNLTIEFA